MELNEYQRQARQTAVYPENVRIIYPALKLAGEAGEVAEKIGKVLRDNGGVFTEDKLKELVLELGDVLWYVSELAYSFNSTLDNVAIKNLEKLSSRQDRGALQGSGDNR